MKNSDTTTFHKICSKPYRQISSNFPEIIISLIVHIEETVMKSRPSHLPCSWILNRDLSYECRFCAPLGEPSPSQPNRHDDCDSLILSTQFKISKRDKLAI